MEISRNWCSEHVIFIKSFNFNFFFFAVERKKSTFFLSLSLSRLVKLSTAGGREIKNLIHWGFSTALISLVSEYSEDMEPERDTEMKICQLVNFRMFQGPQA